MSFVIRNNPFTVPANNAAPKRTPVTIEGEAIVEKTRARPQDKNTPTEHQTQRPETYTFKTEPIQSGRDARLEKYDEQLIGSQRILPPRSPMAAFAQASIAAPRLGSSIDVYA
ncbi:MAG: hypothetical protein U5M23_11325 [Marinagarivorans sp.]|nr:hypothetical protein [Marinagarivorans sp.]